MDPDIGRFMQRDPLGMNPFSNYFDFNPLLNVHVSANLYSYVGNNLIFYVDPLGLVEVEFGTYIGLGKSVKVSPKIEKKDCCKNNVRIVNGIKIAKIGVYAHAGFGLGIKIKVQGIGIDLSWIGPGLIASGEVIIEKNDCLDGLWKGGGCIRGGVDGGTSLSFSVLKWSGHMDIDGEFTAGICIFGDTNGKITLSEEFCYNIGLNAKINLWPLDPKTFDGREEGCKVFSQSISF
jgi:hypothetical protein